MSESSSELSESDEDEDGGVKKDSDVRPGFRVQGSGFRADYNDCSQSEGYVSM